MCQYLEKNKCALLKQQCPYVYFCNKNNQWLPSKSMPIDCKVKQKNIVPKGSYLVCFARHGELYIEVGNETIVLSNPFNYVPQYVKLYKRNGEWIIKK